MPCGVFRCISVFTLTALRPSKQKIGSAIVHYYFFLPGAASFFFNEFFYQTHKFSKCCNRWTLDRRIPVCDAYTHDTSRP